MATITTIASTDQPSASRTVINNNFTNLNDDKIETTVLDTDVTLAADSDSKVATQKATKAYVDTAVSGIGLPTCLTVIPMPAVPSNDDPMTQIIALSGNTTAHIGQVVIPFAITANNITIRTSTISVAGTCILSLFSEDGQTRLFSVTTGNITTISTLYTTNLSAVEIPAGIYYLSVQPTSTANIRTYGWSSFAVPFSSTEGIQSDIAGKPVMQGTVTVTADTAPTTLTPASISESATRETLVIRLDN